MKQSKYIEKVTSYLHNKQNKQEIAIELQDHIDLNTQYYEDIGYDSESAFEKAELAMGDADIVGEELHSLEHGTLVVKILLAVICILTIPFTAIVGYWFYNVDFDVSFLTFVFVAIHFLFMLFGIFFSYKHKRIIANIILSANTVISLFALPRCITLCLYGYLKGLRLCSAFFNDLSFFYYKDFLLEKIIVSVYATLIVIQCVVLLFFTIQQRSFKTTRKLLVLKNIIKNVVLVFLIFNVILVCVVIVDSVHCRNDIKEQASKELIRYSDMVRDNIDAFSKCEMEDVEKFMADNFPEGSYSLTYRLDDQHYANIEPDEDLLVHIECIAENPYGEIRLLLNPTYYDYWGNELKLIDLEEASFENLNLGSSPSEITEPCFWAFYKAKDEKTELYISFSQNDQMYIRENSKIYNKTLQYYYENNHLSLYSNDFWKTENIEFNNEQKKIFENYLKEEFYKSKPNLQSLYDNYDVHYDLSYKVYNIEYNKETACYNVIFDYIAFYTIIYDDVLVGVNNLYEYDELLLDGEQDDLNAYINTVKMTFYMENNKINKATINEYFDGINMWQSPIMFNMFGEEFHSNSSSLTTHSDYINFLNEKYNTKKYYEAEEFENGEFIVGIENGDTYDFRSLKEVLNQ